MSTPRQKQVLPSCSPFLASSYIFLEKHPLTCPSSIHLRVTYNIINPLPLVRYFPVTYHYNKIYNAISFSSSLSEPFHTLYKDKLRFAITSKPNQEVQKLTALCEVYLYGAHVCKLFLHVTFSEPSQEMYELALNSQSQNATLWVLPPSFSKTRTII